MIDYKDLLRRYIAHVIDNEGTDFLSRKGAFTDEEVAEMRGLLSPQHINFNGPINFAGGSGVVCIAAHQSHMTLDQAHALGLFDDEKGTD